MRHIIGIAGYKGSGKSTLAQEFQARGFTRIKFADPLKSMLRVLGLGDEHIEGELKEEPCELLGGRTPRHAMQTLGTEWGRDLIHKDLWVDAWRRMVDARPDSSIVVDDLRFPNEQDVLKLIGGKIVLVERPGCRPITGHISENLDHIDPDYTIHNRSDLANLQRMGQDLINILQGRQ